MDVKKPKSAKRKKRTCLKCNKVFDSWGPANRRCYACSHALSQWQPSFEWDLWGGIRK